MWDPELFWDVRMGTRAQLSAPAPSYHEKAGQGHGFTKLRLEGPLTSYVGLTAGT